jgi:glutamyl-tRNA synthetase
VEAVRGRFAPSPTGDLHLGNARTALLAWLQVRAAGGRFVMRVEDLDRGRVRDGIMSAQLADLRWLGLDWDEGPDVGGPYVPYLQSERTDAYDAAIRQLIDRGAAYPCACSRRDIAEASSAPHAGDGEGPRYPGTCSELPAGALGGRPTAIRFRVREGPVTFRDEVQGSVTFEPARETGDFVIRRKDGIAAYQLAVVVDDAAMRVTKTLRGADLLSSTARQILLMEALGLAPPEWSHVPLLLGPDGERLSKRHGSVTLREARASGLSAEEVVGWLAASCGLAEAGVAYTPRELVDGFSVMRLPRDATVLKHLLEPTRSAQQVHDPR